MKVKRFVGDDVREAMFKVRMEMGSDALILHTRKFKEGGFLGLFARQKVEVTAALDEFPPVVSPRVIFEPKPSVVHGSLAEEPAVTRSAEPETKGELAEVKQLVTRIIDRLEDVQPVDDLPRPLVVSLQAMLANDVEEQVARQILSRVLEKNSTGELGNQEKAGALVEQAIEKALKPIRPISMGRKTRRVVALVGPTGVGKTTTIAKLAADFNLIKGKRVALVTIDTYRIAAVDQLRTYADIIRIPLDVVFTPENLQHALKKHEDKDLILIDTAGRSPKNSGHLSELGGFISGDSSIETHLVLSATTRFQDLLDIVSEFNSAVRVDRLLFTKLDETSVYGSILNLIQRTKKPLSYVTVGQNVPDDIEVADPVKLARSILGVGRQ